jgi:hypothetical protein
VRRALLDVCSISGVVTLRVGAVPLLLAPPWDPTIDHILRMRVRMKIVETSGDSGFRSELKKDRQEGNRGFGRIGLAALRGGRVGQGGSRRSDARLPHGPNVRRALPGAT